MVIVFLIVVVIMFGLILGATFKGIKLNGKNYFIDANYNENQNPEVGFYMKKHTIFRFFALLYEIIHGILQVISITSTSITVYMVMITNLSINIEIFFLLIASISTSLIFCFRFDKLAECYATAMRIMEKAILIYLSQESKEIKILYDANNEAELYIGDKFF